MRILSFLLLWFCYPYLGYSQSKESGTVTREDFTVNCCGGDERTLTEMLFQDSVDVIFSCKIISQFHTNTKGFSSLAEIIKVYFGQVDSNVVTLLNGNNYFSGKFNLEVGKSYLIYTISNKEGRGKEFPCGYCFDRNKLISENPICKNEIDILEHFSNSFKNKKSEKEAVFKNEKGVVLATGSFKNGQANGTWKHYYSTGSPKLEYDLQNNIKTEYYINGFIKYKTTITGNVTVFDWYSDKVNGYKMSQWIDTRNDSLITHKSYTYYENGNLRIVDGSLSKQTDPHSVVGLGLIGSYEEYYENGKIKKKGQYEHYKKAGIWEEYDENGKLKNKIDYKEGLNKQ